MVSLGPMQARFVVGAKGRYHVAIRYSPYWRALPGCVAESSGGDITLTARKAGAIELSLPETCGFSPLAVSPTAP